MKYTKDDLNLESSLTKEWIITNGIGGYASSTIVGANTRKYHGLLVAPLYPPAQRHVILSKLDEAIEVEGKSIPLYTNIGKKYISEGYKHQISFEKDIIPTFEYEVDGILVTKQIVMEYEKNTVCILYKIKNSDHRAKLTLSPILNFRDFHCMHTNHEFNLHQTVTGTKVKAIVDENRINPIYFFLSDGSYAEHIDDIYYNMYYIEEEKRGFFPEENHIVAGTYYVDIMPNEEKSITFVCSLEDNIEEIKAEKVIKQEIKRVEKIEKDSKLISKKNNKKNELVRELVKASDSYIVYRESSRLHTVLAGYHWFLDWGRDALIAFEGLLLVTRRFDIAKEVLQTFIRDIKFGLVPNGYSGYDNRPLYNSVDSSLLLFEQIEKYLKYTKDYVFVKENFYEKLRHIIHSYHDGINLDDNNIYVDSDGLLVSGTENTQNTWMDVKIGPFAVTPRNGKAVEINSLWYNALMIMAKLSKKYSDNRTAEYCNKLAEKCKESFNKKFFNKEKNCLYDVLGDGRIRPNQLFSIALTYPILDPSSKQAKKMFDTVTEKLLNKYGLKTLARGEKNYIEVYSGDGFKRDMSYHQGITWPWLLGVYADAFKKIIEAEKPGKKKKELEKEWDNFLKGIVNTFSKEIKTGICVGSIPELYDSKAPHLGKGAISQAWSVAEILRILVKYDK
ncbi:MAG: glycogen debranching enzyme family protein [Clostridia bacterium]|nr:glycogen debranching enzyme family protein [Clostridia bacterium]